MIRCLSIVLAFLFAVSAQASRLDECWRELVALKPLEKLADGQSLHRRELASYALGAQTVDDLKFEDSLRPWLEHEMITDLGKAHLRWRLSNPSLDPEDIRNRQQAVQELHANPELSLKIKAALEPIAAYQRSYNAFNLRDPNQGQPISKRFRTIMSDSHVRSSSHMVALENLATSKTIRPFSFSLGGYSLIGPPGVLALLYYLPIFVGETGDLGRAIVLGMGALVTNAITIYNLTKEFDANMTYVSQFAHASKALAADLIASKSPYLRDIGDMLYAVEDSNHPLDIAKTGRFLNRVEPTGGLSSLLVGIPAAYTYPGPMFRSKNEWLKFAVLASVLSELDMFQGLAHVPRYEEMIHPTILDADQPFHLSIEDGHLPFNFADRTRPSKGNDFRFTPESGGERLEVMFLTGPNARGKSSALRMLAVNTILAQLGARVPARAMTLTPTQILTNMRTKDSVTLDESSFRAEMNRLAELAAKAKSYPRSLWIVDEMALGTSVIEQHAIEEGFVDWMIESMNGLAKSGTQIAIVSSHKRDLVRLQDQYPKGKFLNFHVSDSDDADRKFGLEQGPSLRYNALEIMTEAGVPADLIAKAQQALDRELARRRNR